MHSMHWLIWEVKLKFYNFSSTVRVRRGRKFIYQMAVLRCKTAIFWPPSAVLEKILYFCLLFPLSDRWSLFLPLGVKKRLPPRPKFVWPPPNYQPHAHLCPPPGHQKTIPPLPPRTSNPCPPMLLVIQRAVRAERKRERRENRLYSRRSFYCFFISHTECLFSWVIFHLVTCTHANCNN